MKTYLVLVSCFLIAALNISCSKSGVGPSDDGQHFALTITAVNSNGGPAGGLIISAWNHIEYSPILNALGSLPSVQKTTAISVIGFEVPVVCHVALGAYDLSGQLIRTIADLPSALVGRHSAQFSVDGSHGSAVYKCRLVATDNASGNVLFSDSIYAFLWQVDASLNTLGSTATDGTFHTTDSLRFPNVFNLPPITATSSVGPTPVGVFQISDSVTVVLTDTTARKSQSYQCIVKRGANDLHLTWNPISNVSSPVAVSRTIRSGGPQPAHATKTQAGWKLDQNYPNPFD